MLPSTLRAKAQQRLRGRNAALPIRLAGGLLFLLPFAVPAETLAGQLTPGPKSEAAAAIERLEELRKTIKPGGLDWRILRYTGGLPINGEELVHWNQPVDGQWEIL